MTYGQLFFWTIIVPVVISLFAALWPVKIGPRGPYRWFK